MIITKYQINELLQKGKKAVHEEVIIKGWVKSFRSNRFIALNDGSTIKTIQVVIEEGIEEEILKKITTAAALKIIGVVEESLGQQQEIEIKARQIKVYGEAKTEEVQETILQPKVHSLEKLREQAHLRFRTNFFSAVSRVRSRLAYAIHQYFNERGFFYIHTPIITASDAEGAGEMFKVTNFDLKTIPKTQEGNIDYSQDFFGKATNLTVSGQLEAEVAAMGLGRVYTFGPTFRAENSNTSRHLAEFWMIEPEVAFNDLSDNMDLVEDFLKSIISDVLQNCQEDLTFLDQRLEKEEQQKPKNEKLTEGLIEKLQNVIKNQFKRVTYTEAIDILRDSKANKTGKFKYPIEAWGVDLQSEHERYLVEKHFNGPVILYNYPAKIKAFYMRQNADNETVRAMDVLFPGIGEIVGGSQREERLDVLKEKMKNMGIEEEELWWYLDTRRFGTVPHSGFGLGFERMVLFVTGMSNIRDVIPFPRTPKSAEF